MTSTPAPESLIDDEACHHLPGCHLAHVPNLFASCGCGLFAEEEEEEDDSEMSPRPVAPAPAGTTAVEVTAKDSLIAATCFIAACDPSAGATGQVVASMLFVEGLRALDDRFFKESPQAVLAEFQAAYDGLLDMPVGQWTMRVPAHSYVIGRLTAKEYGLSMSSLARVCVAYALKARERE